MSVSSIRFGTDGWRALIAEECTFENVGAVASALAAYINKHEKQRARNGVIVGYDTRFLSADFARKAAELIAGAGIPVLWNEKPTPAPVVAWTTRERKLAAGVLVTAGHNGAKWNGIKIFSPSGAPASTDLTNAVEAVLGRRAAVRVKAAGIESFDPCPAYLDQLRRLIDFDLIRGRRGTIVYDAMNGTGSGYVNTLLKECGWKVTVIRDDPDPLFGGTPPDPSEPESHAALQAAVAKKGADIGLATDVDASRFGVVDTNGTYLAPNRVLSLVYLHLLEYRGLRGPVVKSAPTTGLLDAIAANFGERAIETPVGFKWVGAAMEEQAALFGAEESGGLTVSGHCPARDAVLAALLIAEIWALHGGALGEVYKKAAKRFGAPHSHRIDVNLSHEQKTALMAKMKSAPPSVLAGLQVSEVLVQGGVKLNFEDGGWMMLRVSGTEPLVRVYMEAPSTKGLKQLRKAAQVLV